MNTTKLIKQMIEAWRKEYCSIKEHLILKGAEADSYEYGLLATEALRLSECINDASDLLLSVSRGDNEQ